MNPQNSRLAARLTAGVIAAVLVLLSACSLPQVSAEDRLFLPLSLDFVGDYQLPETTLEGTTVGGLSALAYDHQRDRLYALSDDRSRTAPARFYTLKLQDSLGAMGLKVEVEAVTLLKDEQNQVYPQDTIDPEGITLSRHESVFISSEGVASQDAPPFLAEFDLQTGKQRRRLAIPERYWHNPESAAPQGVAENLGFESLAINPEGDRLFTATESALLQDFDLARPEQPVMNRLLHYWVGEPQSFLISEHAYPLGPTPVGALINGLVELIAIDSGGHFLSLERSYSPLTGYAAQIFQVANGGATDTSKLDSFKGAAGIVPARKRLLLDLAQLGIPLENLEGMVLGPHLDGGQSLLLVSDNGFKAKQPTQFLLFRLQRGGYSQTALK